MAGRWRKRSSQDWQTPVPLLGEFFFMDPGSQTLIFLWIPERGGRHLTGWVRGVGGLTSGYVVCSKSGQNEYMNV